MPSCVDKTPSLAVVISTYNREKDLRNALESVILQSSMPAEVIVVDDSEGDATERLVSSLRNAFSSRGSDLRYVKNTGERSLTVARNIGVDESKGDVVMFLDDDVVLEKDYIDAILRVYVDHPEALGVQGFHGGNIETSFAGLLGNAIDRAFMIWFYGRNTCRVMPSFSPTYPHEVSGVISCQWLSGCNMSYRREVFRDLRFDDKLRRYSPGEDVDFSYRVWKRKPGSLLLTPAAHLDHRYAESSRTPKRNLLLVQAVYRRYLFRKCMEPSLKNRLAFAWSNVGRLVTSLMRRTKARISGESVESPLLEAAYLLEAGAICRQHEREIRSGDIDFLDEYMAY